MTRHGQRPDIDTAAAAATTRDRPPSQHAVRTWPPDSAARPGGVLLSLFPGVGIFDSSFEQLGFCVLRGPDALWGGDIRQFFPPAGCAWGVIGGPPCQDFSHARRHLPPTGHGLAMFAEFRRVVEAVAPEWWLLENVAGAPALKIPGYSWQRINVDQGWFSNTRRRRFFQFGSRLGKRLQIPHGRMNQSAEPCAMASDKRELQELIRLQGLPAEFDLPPFQHLEKKRAIGNAVPPVLGRAVARAIRDAYGLDSPTEPPALEWIPRYCRCGCGREMRGRFLYHHNACRSRAMRQRRAMLASGLRGISFAKTTEQIRNQTKDVTRRIGWTNLQPGQQLLACVKCMGLKKGERREPLAIIEVVSVRREPLWKIDRADVTREGFPEMTPSEFVSMFCEFTKCERSTTVTRIEFRYV